MGKAVLLLLTLLLLISSPLEASEEKPFRFDLYSFEGSSGFGLKYEIHPHFFLTVNRDGYPYDLSLQLGANVYLPRKLFFISFYGGGGITIDIFSKGPYLPYLLTGLEGAIFFGETIYYLEEEGIKGRGGLRFSF